MEVITNIIKRIRAVKAQKKPLKYEDFTVFFFMSMGRHSLLLNVQSTYSSHVISHLKN